MRQVQAHFAQLALGDEAAEEEVLRHGLQLRPQGTFLLQDVMPVAFTPFPTGIGGRRTLVLDVGRFRLDP